MVITDPPRLFPMDGSTALYLTGEKAALVDAETIPVGTPFETFDGEPGVVVNAATAHALEVGLAELRRRQKRRGKRRG